MSKVIWIDQNIDNEENKKYVKKLELMDTLKVIQLFKRINDAINYMKQIKFEETKVIISGRLYPELVEKFKENIKNMRFSPKIIVFTKDQDKFIQNNKDFKNEKNKFYSFGGIATEFKQIEDFLNSQNILEINPIFTAQNLVFSQNMVKSKSLVVQIHQSLLKKNDEVQLTFEYIDMKEKLILPLFFKTLIKFDSNDNIEKYTNFLYNKYSNKNLEIYKLFEPILSMTNIPIEILSKYYARLFTSESDFYLDLNKDLGLNKIQDYLLFVKILYEGVKLKSLPLASNNILYRGSKISNEEITKIKDYMAKKIDNLPSSIVFSRSFLSFSKDKSIAEYFLKFKNENKNLSKR